MTEFILPVQPQETSGTVMPSPLSDTATAPPPIPDSCQMQEDALRGAMVECKKAMKRFAECQDTWFRCKHGVSLKSIGSGTPSEIYNAAIGMNSGLHTMAIGLETVSINSGVRIEG